MMPQLHFTAEAQRTQSYREDLTPHDWRNTMNPHKLTLCVIFLILSTPLSAQTKRLPTGGRLAIVVDERLAAVRSTPELTGRLVRRLSRGRMVAIRSFK